MKIPRHDPNSILYLDPTTAPERKSKSLQNFYSLYMDHIGQEWNHFPKRNKSFICATSIDTTGIYGSTYVMVPARRTMVGACPEDDIWFSFSNMHLSTMVELFHNMFTAYHLGDPTTSQELVDHSEKVAELMSRDPNRYQTVDTFSDYARSMLGQARFNPVTLMSYVMDPRQNNFKLIDWPNALPHKVEVWYSEPSYAIPLALFDKLIGPVA
jgi:hypothetical protein